MQYSWTHWFAPALHPYLLVMPSALFTLFSIIILTEEFLNQIFHFYTITFPHHPLPFLNLDFTYLYWSSDYKIVLLSLSVSRSNRLKTLRPLIWHFSHVLHSLMLYTDFSLSSSRKSSPQSISIFCPLLLKI